jgi:hypothetical protein
MPNYSPTVNFAAKDTLPSGNPAKAILGANITTELNAIATMSASKEETSNKNAASGYPGLDASSLVLAAQLGSGTPSATTVLLGNRTWGDQAALTALGNVFTAALKGLVPASGGGTTNYLRADGGWTAPPGTYTPDRTGTDGTQVGFLDIPQIANDASITFALSDRGKHYFKTSSTPRTWTVPANATVAFPIGTAITLINASGTGAVTLALAGGVSMTQASTGSTGNRTLGANAVATIIKTGTDSWYISGAGVT